jgi:hypothetical protein
MNTATHLASPALRALAHGCALVSHGDDGLGYNNFADRAEPACARAELWEQRGPRCEE